jgi:hypothetical protein
MRRCAVVEALREEHEITVAVRESRATPELLAAVQDNVKRLTEFKPCWAIHLRS